MVYRRRIYFVVMLLLVLFIAVMLAFVLQKDKTSEYKGTLVNGYRQEAVV